MVRAARMADGVRAARGVGLLLLASVALVGCGSPSLSVYDLSPVSEQVSHGAPRGLLSIATPLAEQALDSERILVRAADHSLAYLPGVQWSERLPGLIQTRLVQSFENRHVMRSVISSDQHASSDAHLDIEIRNFEYDAGAGQVLVRLSVRLVDDHSGRIRRAQMFSAQQAQASADAQSVIAGLDVALGLVMGQIITWAAGTGR